MEYLRELLEQWTERLKAFLSVDDRDVGVIGAGKRKPTERIDVAMIQSLVRRGEVSDVIAGYGQIIVDECHHLPAVSFELVARRSKAKYVLGLSATVVRKDGHHPFIFMQCGPIRHRVDAKSQAARSSFDHRVVIKETSFRSSISSETERSPIAHIYQELANNERRNALIFDDVLSALEEGRCPIVLTERRQHLDHLADRFRSFVRNLIVLRGGMKVGERKVAQSLINDDDIDERLVLATGRYIGEGFDYRKRWRCSCFGCGDELRQWRDDRRVLGSESMTEIVEEGDAEFLACLQEAEEGVPGVTPCLGVGSA